MTVWSYRAVVEGRSKVRRGRLEANTATEIRAMLRRSGLRPVKIQEIRERKRTQRTGWRAAWQRYQRKRRSHEIAELLDGLATLLDSGTALLQSVQALEASSKPGGSRAELLGQVGRSLRSGKSLAAALEEAPGWFGPMELAIVRAAEHAGNLPATLAELADRGARTNELQQKVIGALLYPAILGAVGLGVWAFLSKKTLPAIVQLLTDHGVEVPALTARVQAAGQWISLGSFLLTAFLVSVVGVAGWLLSRWLTAKGIQPKWWPRSPKVVRQLGMAQLCAQLSTLLAHGVPAVDALRVLGPATRSAPVRARLREAVDEVERGGDLSEALRDPNYFDAEFRQLVELGERSGELPRILNKLAKRTERKATRSLERLTALLEPAMILALSVAIGTVVLAAVLPMTRLQELVH